MFTLIQATSRATLRTWPALRRIGSLLSHARRLHENGIACEAVAGRTSPAEGVKGGMCLLSGWG